MGTIFGKDVASLVESGTAAVASRRGLMATALAAVLGGATGGLRGDLRVAAEEAGMVLRGDEAWDILVGDGGLGETEGRGKGKRNRYRHVRVRFKRRRKICRGVPGQVDLTCVTRCRKGELMMSGGCMYAGPDQDEEAMILVQGAPLNRQNRYGCQWTSIQEGGLTVQVRYQAIVVCRRPKRG